METILHANPYVAPCPSRQVLDFIGSKWSVLIIGLLEEHPQRFSELQRSIGGISQKMLAQTLRNLERDGLVKREVYAEVPPRVTYALTPLGTTLCAPLAAIRNWAEAHIDEVTRAQNRYDAQT